jgi:ATP-dependent Clp protease ATP-binding subunit ClpC
VLVGAGSAGSSVDAANILKPALARGELQCIGATTMEEYRKHIEGDAALERRFQPVQVDEPSVEETIEILKGIRPRYEAHHNLKFTDDALTSAAHLSARYVTDRFMPDKAIDLIDEAGSRVRLYKVPYMKDMDTQVVELREVRKRMQEAIAADKSELAASLREREKALLSEVQEKMGDRASDMDVFVTDEDIADVVSMVTGIPLHKIATEESKRLLEMENALHNRVIGQQEAIVALSKAIRRARAGLKNPKRPIGTFMFLGPTGVGKTLLAKTLAEFLFGSDEALIKLDMSEFMERHSVSRLVGSPPGYVGYEDGGQLTEAVRRRPYSVILFDEIEKAHPEAFNMLLQVMEDGQLADAKGKNINFRNTILIMTSNVGADLIKRTSLGFQFLDNEARTENEIYKDLRKKVLGEMERVFRPEFRNRLDGTIIFRPLSREEIKDILDYELREIRSRLNEQGITISLSERAKEYLADKGYDPDFGARPLRRVLQNEVEDLLSEGLLAGKYHPEDDLEVDYLDSEIIIHRRDDILETIDDIASPELIF